METARRKGNVTGMAQDSLAFAPWLGVFETVCVLGGVPLFAREHRTELQRSATALGLPIGFDLDQATRLLPLQSGRWRWLVTPQGTADLFHEEEIIPDQEMVLSVSPVRVGSQNWDARFKTVSYLTHIQALRWSATPEVVLLNERGEVSSAAQANIFWRKGDRLFTPAHESGCRCGIVRGFILDNCPAEQGYFPVGELLAADEAFLTNSMRGITSVRQVEEKVFQSWAFAEEARKTYGAAVAAQLT